MTYRRILLAATVGVGGGPLLAHAQTETPPQKAAPKQEIATAGSQDEGSETEPGTEDAVEPPPPPPPDGLLPLSELTRIVYAPRDRPKPLLDGNVLLIVSESGFVDGYDARTGEFAWKLGLPGEKLFDPVVFTPAPVEPGDAGGAESFQILLTEPLGHWLIIDGTTGEIEREGRLGFELALAPVKGPGDVLFLATPSGDVYAYDVSRREVVFQTATGERPLALAATESLLVVSGGEQTLTALDLPEGSLRWTFQGRAAFHAPAAFTEKGDRVLIGDDAGELYALDARRGKIKFRWSTGAAIRSRILVENKRMYVASYANTVYAYNTISGDEHWRADLPGRPATPPIRVNARLMVGTFDGILVEISPPRGIITKQYAAPGEIVHSPSFFLARPDLKTLESEEDALPPDEGEGDGDTVPAEVPRKPLWFERSRIALALRNGEVLLLWHQVPVPEPPETEGEPTDSDEGSEDDAVTPKRPPTHPSVPF